MRPTSRKQLMSAAGVGGEFSLDEAKLWYYEALALG
jgi:hypothetical protein